MEGNVKYLETIKGIIYEISPGKEQGTVDGVALGGLRNTWHASTIAAEKAGVSRSDMQTMLQNGAVTIVPQEQ